MHPFTWAGLIAVFTIGTTACAPLPMSQGGVNVSSTPVGAEVWVMGRKVGATPLVLGEIEVFPVTFGKEQAALYGMVELRSPHCATLQTKVSASALANGLKMVMDCGGATALGPKPIVQPASVVERLSTLQELLNKGLISADEARITRQRILSSF
jgi:hypothetical protein